MIKKLIHKNKWLCIQILLLLVIALFSDFIANENPILIRKDGKLSSPIFSPAKYRLNDDSELIIIPPIPYSPNTLDYKNAKSIGPFDQQHVNSYRYRHWLGTDELGRDILSGIIHGTSMALIVGIGSMLIASLIGISLGSLAGFFGNDHLKIGPITTFFSIIGLMIGYLLSFHQTIYFNDANTLDISINQIFNLLIFISCTYVFSYIGQRVNQLIFKLSIFNFPLDHLISRIIELVKSLPSLFIIIGVIAILKPSVWNIIWIIGLIAWTGIARYCRAEVLKIKNYPFIESAKALGISEKTILFKHILPSALQASTVYIVFGVAGAILAESTLSFMGIGITADSVSWGSILSEARKSPTSWWLAIFPGLAIFYTLLLLNKLAMAIEHLGKPN